MGRFSQTRNAIRSIKLYNKEGMLVHEFKLDEKGRHICPIRSFDIIPKDTNKFQKNSEMQYPVPERLFIPPNLKKISYEEELSNLENMTPLIKEEPTISFEDLGTNIDFDVNLDFCMESLNF